MSVLKRRPHVAHARRKSSANTTLGTWSLSNSPVVHILFLAVGLPWLVVRRGESLVLKLIGAEDVRWVTDGRPVSVEVQAIPPRAAVRVRVDDGHAEHFDVLAVDSDALVGGVVANPDQIWLEVIVGLERAVSAGVLEGG